MNKKRPVNLDLSTIRLPITSYVSILHRISGVVLLGGVLVLFFMLDMSLSSQESFNEVLAMLTLPWVKLIIWAVLAALSYHFVAGVRHLIMDMGFAESLEGGKLGAKFVIALFLIVLVLAGVWIW